MHDINVAGFLADLVVILLIAFAVIFAFATALLAHALGTALIVGIVVVTTFLAPLLLKRAFREA